MFYAKADLGKVDQKVIAVKLNFRQKLQSPDTLTSPQLTAEWENNLTQIAKGKADPAAFMEGIENMARELVKTYPFLSDDKAQMFKPEREALGSCPRCGSPVYEGKKNYYCSNKECIFTMWKNDRFFEERKVTFTPKIAAALLKSGMAQRAFRGEQTCVLVQDAAHVLVRGNHVWYEPLPPLLSTSHSK